MDIAIVDESWDRRYYLIHVSSDRDAGEYIRYDAEKGSLQRLAFAHPQLAERTLYPMRPIRYPARDGASIPGYLTLPESAVAGGGPAVILPHGGPESRDYWGYDWLVQYLASKGYAVLQINYRGSAGFGSQWLGEGGFRDWRTTVDDITDGARYLVEANLADADRMCIVGWSYGGYAALLSAVEEPERYRCAISIAGVTDLPMLIDDSREFSGWKRQRERIGRNPQTLRQGSPARRADEFQAPVLLFHGDDDLNVDISHSRKMHKELRDSGKSVELVEYEGVEHSIRKSSYRRDMLARMGAFLDEHTKPVLAAH